MKKILLFLSFVLPLFVEGQKPRNFRQEITSLRNALLKYHAEPRSIDDKFSSDLYDRLINELDPDRIYFTRAQLQALEVFRTQLDEEVNGKTTAFFGLLKDSYRVALQRSEQMSNKILASPLDWRDPESYDPHADWAEDEKALYQKQRHWLKFNILDRLVELAERDSTTSMDFFQQNIAQATAYVKLTALRPLKRLLSNAAAYDNEMSDVFLQSIASVFDPHSTFFSTTQYEQFVAALSTEDYYFGFTLDEDEKGNVIIGALAPGGPAWKSGVLRVSDRILAIKWEGEQPIDINGMDIYDVNELLSDNNGTQIELSVNAVDGQERTVVLRKAKLESEQDIVQSFILDGEIKAGYIYLPDFYTRLNEGQEGGRCASDVAREIMRLKKEGIDGLILDLRFNGGGSLLEARAMAGIFIDEGPLAMTVMQDKKVVTLKDMNRGTVYDGPLILLVNGQSASASEVLAASIQDYHRGLIVGSRTYGKATGQNLLPVEGEVSKPGSVKSTTGYVKVTTQRLYRVTGKSAQGRGVVPDIQLPDLFAALHIRESEEPFALQADSILVNPYYKPLLPLKRKELQELSAVRVASSPVFGKLQDIVISLENGIRKENEPRELTWDAYSAAIAERRQRQANMSELKSNEKVFDVSFSTAKEHHLAVDGYARELQERWVETLASDIYLQETFHVLRDHLSLIKNPK